MLDYLFGNPPENGKSVVIKPGNLVEVWVNGKLSTTKRFPTRVDAERFQREEVLR